MPTPVTHLVLAQEMLRRGDLSTAAKRLLKEHVGQFMLGHTAPDVKTVSGQERVACHFYAVPRTSSQPAYRVLFDAHPMLIDAATLPAAQAAFVAGYIAHLLLDELWLDDVFQHCFLREWGPLRERLFLHNVLRTWIDARDQQQLDGAVVQLLQQADPGGWLPFVDDGHLRQWRDWLVDQLAADHAMETAEVFAHRMGITASEIMQVVRSPRQMASRVFRHFPRSALHTFQEKGHRQSVMLVNWYIGALTREQYAGAHTSQSVAGPGIHQS